MTNRRLLQHAPHNAERGSRHAPLKDLRPLERGYDHRHRKIRAEWEPRVACPLFSGLRTK